MHEPCYLAAWLQYLYYANLLISKSSQLMHNYLHVYA